MIQVDDRLVDYKKLKKIFSDNRNVMEQVMMGLIVTAHEKAPALKRFYAAQDWDRLVETSGFIESAYKHIATKQLIDTVTDLQDHVSKRNTSHELESAIDHTVELSKHIIRDIEYYLSEN